MAKDGQVEGIFDVDEFLHVNRGRIKIGEEAPLHGTVIDALSAI